MDDMSVEAFQARILPVKNKLYRFAVKLLQSEEDAKDVVQEVLIKVWNRREELGHLKSFEAWCMTVTRNLSIDRLKSKHNKSGSFPEGFEVEEKNRGPLESLEISDEMKKVNQFIQELPDKQRQIILLRDIEGYSYNEIGEILGIDLNQVKVNLFRARKNIKENLLNINSYGL
jgi:RNA polymerase sigma-70 factor (ECF subfamily)